MNLRPQVDSDPESVYAVVLAAGTASRFGATKQVFEIDGIPMVRLAIAAANSACGDRTVLVTGHDARSVVAACGPMQGRVARNPDYRSGLGTSIAGGVAAVRGAASAVIILLADQPRVTASHVGALIDAWDGAPDAIVATAFAGTKGPPALFGAGCFDALCELQGDSGAKPLFADDRFTLRTVHFEPAGLDIDTRAQLKAQEH